MNIYESISAIQADVDFIGKEKETQSGSRFKYRGVDQVLNTLHPLFAKHKVFAVPEVLDILGREWRQTERGGNVVYQTLKVKYTFYAEDGSNVSAVVIGEAMDSGDKSSNKCMSVAYKYACFQILSIPTEETTADPDEHNEELAAFQCFICGKEISRKFHDQTVTKYGVPLCSAECKEKWEDEKRSAEQV